MNKSCSRVFCTQIMSSKIVNLPQSPPPITIERIAKMSNRKQLKELEKKYDEFLEKNFQILMLYNIAEQFLDIRDALTIRISRVIREEKIKVYVGRNILMA